MYRDVIAFAERAGISVDEAVGGWSERIVYSTGAMAGALSGLWVGNLIL
jgi:hypothetical protein